MRFTHSAGWFFLILGSILVLASIPLANAFFGNTGTIPVLSVFISGVIIFIFGVAVLLDLDVYLL